VLSSIAELPRSRKIAAGTGALVLAGGLASVLLVLPRVDERAQARAQLDALRLELTQARTDELRLRLSRVETDALRRQLLAAIARLPTGKEMPGLYREIADVAHQSGVELAIFTPKPPEDRDDLTAVPIAVVTEGGYYQLVAFLSRLGRLRRVVNLRDLRVAKMDGSTGAVRAEFLLEAFMLRAQARAVAVRPVSRTAEHRNRATPDTGTSRAR